MEKRQVTVLNEVITIPYNFDNIDNHNVIFVGGFDNFFETLLDAKVVTPILKRRSIIKLIKLNEMLDFVIYGE